MPDSQHFISALGSGATYSTSPAPSIIQSQSFYSASDSAQIATFSTSSLIDIRLYYRELDIVADTRFLDATFSQIIDELLRRHRSRLMRANHPDRGGDQNKAARINNAYDNVKSCESFWGIYLCAKKLQWRSV